MIQGTHMLPKSGEYLVITKSMKDCMVLYELGIPAIAPCSETTFISDSQYRKLKERFDNIVILWDNDLTGIKFANKFRKQYDIIPLWLPRDTHKDISDYYKAEGKKKTLELIEKGKQCIREAKEAKKSQE